jgi:hypothetical protein
VNYLNDHFIVEGKKKHEHDDFYLVCGRKDDPKWSSKFGKELVIKGI